MLLGALKPDEFVIALDQDGATPDIPRTRRLLAGWTEAAKNWPL